MRRSPRRLAASLVVSVLLLTSLTTPVFGWSNGLGDGYGTHDWIIGQAVKVFDGHPPAWFDLDAANQASDDPDTVFYATNEHVFNEKGYGRGAVDRITEFYHQVLVLHAAGDDHGASVAFGWMAHYYGDILQPFHTNYAAIDQDVSHSNYEHLVQAVTRDPDASPDWSTTDRSPRAVTDVRTTAIAAAAYSRGFYPELFAQFHADETVISPRVSEITGYVLKRASSDLADILFSLDQGVGDATPVASVVATVRYAHIAQNTTQTVYVTVKDAAGHPLEGVRVDVAFPKAAGGTTLMRRYTTAAGTVPFYAAVGASPLGVRRPVAVTVTTGDATVVSTPSFMATRRLASGSAGFKSWVNDGTVTLGQTLRVGSLARDTKGRPVTNLKVSLTWTFSNGRVTHTVAYTNALGKAVSTLAITTNTPRGRVHVTARVQSGSVNRSATTTFRRY